MDAMTLGFVVPLSMMAFYYLFATAWNMYFYGLYLRQATPDFGSLAAGAFSMLMWGIVLMAVILLDYMRSGSMAWGGLLFWSGFSLGSLLLVGLILRRHPLKYWNTESTS